MVYLESQNQKIPLKLFNTMGREKEIFKPLTSIVKMYSCGPTVYDYTHIGHFRAYIFVDTLKRTLQFNGYKLNHVMNITDVGHLTSDADTGEDKVEKKARIEKKRAWEITEHYTQNFFETMNKLNVLQIEIVCKATDYIREMIEFIKKIEKNGFTYRTSDGIYFDTSKITDYGKLESHNKKKETNRIPRIKSNIEKRNIADFALWKFSTKNHKRQMEWISPWGTGFPGWHIECSVMSNQCLGEQIDIHTGGIDHIPIHHTNEIAQSQAASGKDPVKYWLHNEFVMVEREKMAKSKQNYITMKEIEDKGHHPLALRYLFLTTHYRSKINFTWKSLTTAEKTLATLHKNIIKLKEPDTTKTDNTKVKSYQKEFLKSINDDLNTGNAVKVLWKLLRKEKKINNKDKYKLLLEFDEILGLNLKEVKEEKVKLPTLVKKLIEEREKARNNKDYETADKKRIQLIEKFDIILTDTSEGPKWKKTVRSK